MYKSIIKKCQMILRFLNIFLSLDIRITLLKVNETRKTRLAVKVANCAEEII